MQEQAESSSRQLARIGELMVAQEAGLVSEQLKQIAAVPGYRDVPRDELSRSCSRNVWRVARSLSGVAQLPEHVRENEARTGARRAAQDIAIDDVVTVYRMCLGVLRDAFIVTCGRVGARPETVLDGLQVLWRIADDHAAMLVQSYNRAAIEAAQVQELHRNSLLRRLIGGDVTRSELETGGAVNAILGAEDYFVICVRARDLEPRLPQRLAKATTTSDLTPLMTIIESDVVCLARRVPDEHLLPGIAIGVEGPGDLGSVASMFRSAMRALTAATALGISGVVDCRALSVRLAVAENREIGGALSRQYVSPVCSEADAGLPLLTTLDAWLCAGLSVAQTAKRLRVHENTVRYRLKRFESLTGVDLADFDQLVELWWVLSYRRISWGDS